MNDEKIFYESNSVKLTNSKLIIDGQYYQLSQLNHIGMRVIPKNRSLAWKFLAVGIITTIVGIVTSFEFKLPLIIIGILIFAIGLLLFLKAKEFYYFTLTMFSGTKNSAGSHNREIVEKIIEATNNKMSSKS